LVGCPKLDDCGQYVAKLAAIIRQAEIRSIAVAHMEVPCCTGLVRVARAAIQQAGITVPLHDLIVTRHGEVLESSGVAISGSGVSLTGVQLPVV
jgi:hypothetical protein